MVKPIITWGLVLEKCTAQTEQQRFLAKHVSLSYNEHEHLHKRARRSSYHETGFMKILTLSDTVVDLVHSPRIAERFRDVDLVLSCGDLPWEYLEFVVTMLAKRVLYVYGNHAQKNVWDGVHEIRSVAPGGCENVHRRVVNHAGLLIAGLEGSMRYNEGEHQYTQGEMDWLDCVLGCCGSSRNMAARCWGCFC